jgi:hypothetical protein
MASSGGQNMSDEVSDIIRTRELRLVDKSGKDRAILTTDADGGVTLSFSDNADKPRLRVGLLGDGRTVLEMGHGVGTPNFSLHVEADGRLLLEGVDNDGIERFKLEIKGNGSHTEVAFSEKYKRPRMVLMAEDNGPAGVFILDQHGKALFTTMP